MRTELAPLRLKRPPSPRAPDISLCVVAYSDLHPYYDGREDIMKLCLSSMLEGARGYDYELLIWDNGKNPVYSELLKGYKPTFYVQSENIGGYNGRREMLKMARGKYACITDDDVLFSKDWLQKQFELVHAFKGHTATGIPRNSRGNPLPILYTMKDIRLYVGKFLPKVWYDDLILAGHINGVTLQRFPDFLVEKSGNYGWVEWMDTQLFGPLELLMLGHEKYCAETISSSGGVCGNLERNGILQLATLYRTCYHIGNVIDESVERVRQEMRDRKHIPINYKGNLHYDGKKRYQENPV